MEDFQICSTCLGTGHVSSNTKGWQPIETAPHAEGALIACCWIGHHPWVQLCWKTNPRTGRSYFGDPNESDDYDLADDQPTHWLPIPQAPK